MAREIGALDYIECSALSGAGVDDIIDGAMWAFVMDAQTERGKNRTPTSAVPLTLILEMGNTWEHLRGGTAWGSLDTHEKS